MAVSVDHLQLMMQLIVHVHCQHILECASLFCCTFGTNVDLTSWQIPDVGTDVLQLVCITISFSDPSVLLNLCAYRQLVFPRGPLSSSSSTEANGLDRSNHFFATNQSDAFTASYEDCIPPDIVRVTRTLTGYPFTDDVLLLTASLVFSI